MRRRDSGIGYGLRRRDSGIGYGLRRRDSGVGYGQRSLFFALSSTVTRVKFKHVPPAIFGQQDRCRYTLKMLLHAITGQLLLLNI